MTFYLDFPAPAQLRPRGTVLVVPGRGESQDTYGRFGRRLAADAYRVRIIDPLPLTSVSALDRLAAALADAIDDGPDEPARPLVLVGSDAGAVGLAALAAISTPAVAWWPQALVLAGLPGYGAAAAGEWSDELDVRSHCPVHRGLLTEDFGVRRGALAEAVPDALLDLAYGSTAELPQLLLVGDADPLADRAALDRLVKALPKARLSTVRDGHHDVLNDLQHRSVAAEVVSFLEALRTEPPLTPAVMVASSAW